MFMMHLGALSTPHDDHIALKIQSFPRIAVAFALPSMDASVKDKYSYTKVVELKTSPLALLGLILV
jgi:hypothetical protein